LVLTTCAFARFLTTDFTDYTDKYSHEKAQKEQGIINRRFSCWNALKNSKKTFLTDGVRQFTRLTLASQLSFEGVNNSHPPSYRRIEEWEESWFPFVQPIAGFSPTKEGFFA
jgi:hypothetical protein